MSLDFLFILVVFINASIGLGVFLHNPKHKVNQFFTAFVIFLDLWMVSNFLENEPGIVGEKNLGLFLRLDFVSAILAVYMLFRFCSNFVECIIESREFRKYRVALFLTVIFLVTCSLFTPFIFTDTSFFEGTVTFRNGILWPLYALILASLVGGGLTLLLRERLKPVFDEKSRMRHQQITFISLGVILSLSNAIFINFFQGFYPIDLEISRLGLYGMTFLVAFTAYAIIRHHLMDISIIIRLGAIYALLFATITFLYAYLASLVGLYTLGSLTYIIPSLVITFGFIPLKRLVETLTDRTFFRKKYSTETIIAELNSIIHKSGLNLDELLENFNRLIMNFIRVEHAVILLLNPQGEFVSHQPILANNRKLILGRDNSIVEHIYKYPESIIDKDHMVDVPHEKLIGELTQLGFALIMPIEVNRQIMGLYLITEKKSQDPFTDEEINLLRLIAAESGASIDNARLFNELKRVDEVKSKFISIISHQLRTPLTSIRWNLELLLNERFDKKERQELFHQSYQGALNMAKNLDDLFMALDIEEKGGTARLKKELVNFHELLGETVKEFESDLASKKLHLDISVPDKLPALALDKEKIIHVLAILLHNAIAYSNPVKEINVVGYTNTQDDGIPYFVCAVRDQGMGITPEDEKNIFSRFYRSEEAKKHSPNGYGLGLFVAKYFVGLHGGELWYTSHGPKKGATFSFSLPLEQK